MTTLFGLGGRRARTEQTNERAFIHRAGTANKARNVNLAKHASLLPNSIFCCSSVHVLAA